MGDKSRKNRTDGLSSFLLLMVDYVPDLMCFMFTQKLKKKKKWKNDIIFSLIEKPTISYYANKSSFQRFSYWKQDVSYSTEMSVLSVCALEAAHIKLEITMSKTYF